MKHFQEENRRQIEQQNHFSKQFAEMKSFAVALQAEDDSRFEDNMKHLEEEHKQQLQHQTEMMCQVTLLILSLIFVLNKNHSLYFLTAWLQTGCFQRQIMLTNCNYTFLINENFYL